jgi:hypothetical protein
MAAAVMPLPERSPVPFDPTMPPADRCRALIAALPDALQEVLASGHVQRHSRFRDDTFDDVAETWLPPATVDTRHAAMAQRALDVIEHGVLAPAEPNQVLARVLALLSHFPAKGLTPDVEQMVALDWAEDLGEFPAWAIDQAARTWRRTKKWRPSIAEMRTLCEEACAQERRMAEWLRAVARTGSDAGVAGPGAVLRLAGAAVRRMP